MVCLFLNVLEKIMELFAKPENLLISMEIFYFYQESYSIKEVS